MKQKRLSSLLLLLAILLILSSVFFLWRKALPSKTIEQAQTITDWVHASGGILNVMISYPAELRLGEKNLITITYEADPVLEAFLNKGYTLDAVLSAPKSVIRPQQRLLIPIEKGRQVFLWEMETFVPGGLDAKIQMAMGDSNLSGNYAITPQNTFELSFPVVEPEGLSPNTSLKVGLGLLALSGILLVAYFFNQKRLYGGKG